MDEDIQVIAGTDEDAGIWRYVLMSKDEAHYFADSLSRMNSSQARAVPIFDGDGWCVIETRKGTERVYLFGDAS